MRFLLLVGGLSLVLAACAAPTRSDQPSEFPAFVYMSASSLEGYRIAVRHPDLLAVLPCYCGCVGMEHQNLKDCFIKPEGEFEQHASACYVCVQEALRAAQMRDRGSDFKAIRATIDAEFSKYGSPTETPMP